MAQEVQVAGRMDSQDIVRFGRRRGDCKKRFAEGRDGRARQTVKPARMLGVGRIKMRRGRDDGEGDWAMGGDGGLPS
jgi:hypothetical protein